MKSNRINDFVVVDRNGNPHPKAKSLILHCTVEEASREGLKTFGKYKFQIITYTEFKRTYAYTLLMKKIQMIEKQAQMIANLKRTNALSQKHSNPSTRKTR